MITNTLRSSLRALVGTWRTEGRILGDGSDAGTWSGWDVYEWFPGEQQMVHRVDVTIEGVRQEALEIFTPRDGSVDTFDQTSFAADGSVERAVGRFDARGRYHNDAQDARATLTVESASSMSALWESRDADGAWHEWMEVTFTRVGDPDIEVRSKTDHTG